MMMEKIQKVMVCVIWSIYGCIVISYIYRLYNEPGFLGVYMIKIMVIITVVVVGDDVAQL